MTNVYHLQDLKVTGLQKILNQVTAGQKNISRDFIRLSVACRALDKALGNKMNKKGKR